MAESDRRQPAASAVLPVVVLVVGLRYLHAQGDASQARAAPARAPSVALDRGGGRDALVHVAGAVRRPGVYRLGPGKRVEDAVARAGGPTSKGDANAINLAAKVSEGQQVLVPRRGAGAGAAAGGGEA